MFRFYSVLSVRKLETAPTVLVRVPKMRPSKMVSFLVRETCLVRNIDRTSATTFRSGGEVSKVFCPLLPVGIDMQIWRIGADRWGVAVETRSKIRNTSASCADLSNLRFAHLSIDEAHLGLATVPAGLRAPRLWGYCASSEAS